MSCIICGQLVCACESSIICGGGLTGGLATSATWTVIPEPARAWECPRCRAINAPHATQCTCAPEVTFAPPYVAPGNPPPFTPYDPFGGLFGVTCCAVNGDDTR